MFQSLISKSPQRTNNPHSSLNSKKLREFFYISLPLSLRAKRRVSETYRVNKNPRHFGRNFILTDNQRITVKFLNEVWFYANIHRISCKKPSYSLLKAALFAFPQYVENIFHNMWRISSTICGREIPQHVEERIVRCFTANLTAVYC